MSHEPKAKSVEGGRREPAAPVDRTPSYVAVLVIEAVVVLGLWGFGRYFSG